MLRGKLTCTGCGREYAIDTLNPRCVECSEPLEVSLDVERAGISSEHNDILQRYRGFLPFRDVPADISLGEGHTPLVHSPALASELGLASLHFKNEAINPTWSFKDRGSVAGVAQALALEIRRIGTVSTGNMAASVAAFGARAGLETWIIVSSDLPKEKVAPIAVYSPHLVMVDGDYGELYKRSLEIGSKLGIHFINSDVPFRVEGSKTIAFEICEQLGFAPPDFVIVPVSAGGNLRGIIKGFEEFLAAGLIERLPRFVAVQARGCSPIARAFEQGVVVVERFDNPDTIAKAISNPLPPSGNEVLRTLRIHGGIALAVADEEIRKAQVLMASQGIFGQPASAAPLAAVRRMIADGTLKPTHSVVCVVTGAGLKSMSSLKTDTTGIRKVALAELESAFAS